MTKRILLIVCLLAALILPAGAAAKTHRRGHSVARSRKSKAKSARKSPRRARSAASRKGKNRQRR